MDKLNLFNIDQYVTYKNKIYIVHSIFYCLDNTRFTYHIKNINPKFFLTHVEETELTLTTDEELIILVSKELIEQ